MAQLLTHKQLAIAYGVTSWTLTRWLRKLFVKHPDAAPPKFNRYYTEKQKKIIFDHLGNPFTE